MHVGQNPAKCFFLKDPEDKFLPALWTRSQLMSKEAGSEDNDLAREVGRMIIEHFDAECCLREHKVKVRVQCQRKEMNFIDLIPVLNGDNDVYWYTARKLAAEKGLDDNKMQICREACIVQTTCKSDGEAAEAALRQLRYWGWDADKPSVQLIVNDKSTAQDGRQLVPLYIQYASSWANEIQNMCKLCLRTKIYAVGIRYK